VKRKTKKTSPFLLTFIFLSVVTFAFTFGLKAMSHKYPCANSITCAKDLTGFYDTKKLTAVFNGKQITIPPQIYIPGSFSILGDSTPSNKHIYVDLAKQRLYAYERGRLIKSFLISSGKVGFDTPIGKFYIFKKRPLVRMSWFYGPDNPNNYDLPNVPDVMSFKGPFTIHGAYWHNNWGHKMSHGCVNVSLPNADWLYQWTPEGTAVIIQN